MRLIAWLLTIAFALAGLALRVQGGVPFAFLIGNGLLIAAALACPVLWAKDAGPLSWLGVTGRDRALLILSLLLAAPLLLPLPFGSPA